MRRLSMVQFNRFRRRFIRQSFADLGITSLDLNVDATQIELPDGSVITGQATFTRNDGSTGTAADVTLTAEAIFQASGL